MYTSLFLLWLVVYGQRLSDHHLQKRTCFGSGQDFVTFEDFGAKGDGQDETNIILYALGVAKSKKIPVKLLSGKTYKLIPLRTIDITGIPAFAGNGTLDLSAAGSNSGNTSLQSVFEIKGTKKNLATLNVLHSGTQRITIDAGLDLKKNDILFLSSSEALPNALRPYYCKGQRLRVQAYNASTGQLDLTDTLTYSYDKACLWLNDYQPFFEVDNELRFITSPMNMLACFRLYYAKGLIGGYYKNFALTAIMFKSSEGVVNEMKADLPVTRNNGYSHCIEIADMSDVTVKNCTLSGGRHVVSGGGGGLWEKEECGQQKGHAGYPSVMLIDGGVYRGSDSVEGISADIATLDAHGVVEKMTIKNCTVYGGINLGARVANISNVIIYPGNKRAFNIGNDVSPGSVWGDYTIENVTIHNKAASKIPIFSSKSDVSIVKLRNVDVDNLADGSLLMDFRYNSPKHIDITTTRIKNGGTGYSIVTNATSVIKIDSGNLKENNIRRLNY